MKWLLTSGQRSGVRDLIWGPGAAPRLWVWHPWAKIKGALDVGGNELVNVVLPWGGPVSPSCPDVPVLMSPSCPDVTCRWLQSPSPQLIGWTVFHQEEETQSHLFQFSVDLFTCLLVHSSTRSLVDPSAPAHCMSVWWPDLWPFRSVVSFLQMRGTGSRRRPSPSGSTSISSRWVSLGLYSLDMWWPLTFEMGEVL